MRLKEWVRRLASLPRLPRAAAIAPGVYPYLRCDGGTVARFHLRVDADGTGLLLANAAAAARLHPTGVLIAKGLLEGEAVEAIAARLTAAFHVARATALEDIEAVAALLREIEKPLHRFPVLNLVDPAFAESKGEPAKPLLADVTLAPPGVARPILERLWQAGIPHVAFALEASSSANDLVRCVERAEDIGMISGARGTAAALSEAALLDRLAMAGVDYLSLGCASSEAALHDRFYGKGDFAALNVAIEAALAREVCPVAVVPLVADNLPGLEATLAFLVGRGVADVMLFAIAAAEPVAEGEPSAGPLRRKDLVAAAHRAEYAAEALGVRLIWCPTVRFEPSLGVAELVRRGPRTSGELAVRVEPDGSVILPRGPHRAAGNILDEDWDAIARGAACAAYRQRLLSDTHCADCPGLAICAAECPKHEAGWAAPACSEDTATCEEEP